MRQHHAKAKELAIEPKHPQYLQRAGDALVHLGHAWQLAQHLDYNAEPYESAQATQCDKLYQYVQAQATTATRQSFEQSQSRAQELHAHALKRVAEASPAYASIQASARKLQALRAGR